MDATLNNTSIITLSWKAIIDVQILSNSVLKYASFLKNCTPGWALFNQNLTPLKVNASLKSKFNTQKHCFNSQKHSALKQQIIYGSRISTLFGHTSKAIYDRYKICNARAPFKNKHNSFVVPYLGSYCFWSRWWWQIKWSLFIHTSTSKQLESIWLETTPLHS